ncbi:unnamed protein product [Lupinus luteus]|uniref:Uncharacterized protein n=1 Tax=Lupinus luteus TaxID=3873 RepID=A0AAV1WNU2_LUPLU
MNILLTNTTTFHTNTLFLQHKPSSLAHPQHYHHHHHHHHSHALAKPPTHYIYTTTHAPTKPPTHHIYTPSPPFHPHPPSYPFPASYVVVQDVFYTKSCKHAGHSYKSRNVQQQCSAVSWRLGSLAEPSIDLCGCNNGTPPRMGAVISSQWIFLGITILQWNNDGLVIRYKVHISILSSSNVTYDNANSSMYNDETPHSSLSKGCGVVPVVSRDDDEIFSGCSHPNTKPMSFRPMTNIDDRIRKTLASKYSKVALESKVDIRSSCGESMLMV